MTHQDKKLMCTSLDCPERTGGECNFEIPLLEELLAEFDKKFTHVDSAFFPDTPISSKYSLDDVKDFLTTAYKRIKEEGRREGVEEAIYAVKKTSDEKDDHETNRDYDKYEEAVDEILERLNSLKSKNL